VLLFAAVAIGLALPGPVFADADIHVRLTAMDQLIIADAGNPELYLKRAELHRLHRDWTAALADYRQVRHLAPNQPALDFYLGRMWHEAGQPERAKAALDRVLTHDPDHAHALLIRARVLAVLENRFAAVEDISRAIEQFASPTPEMYLERARWLVAEGEEHTGRALRGLDKGIEHFGPVVTLIQYAIEIETERGHYDAALARLDSLPKPVQRLPVWITRRGDILSATGRMQEARATYQHALGAIETLPAPRRSTRAIALLEARLRTQLQ
jgi:tetratricopeptide (TPR) repeat protein